MEFFRVVVLIFSILTQRAFQKKNFSERLSEYCRLVGGYLVRFAGIVAAKTGIGGTRVVDLQLGEQLPRIC